jgi:hypothetical protein
MRYELKLPTTGSLHEACNGPHVDRQDRERGTLPLLAGFPEILAWFRRRLGPESPLQITGPGDFPGQPPGSFEIQIDRQRREHPPAYACPYMGPTRPHPISGDLGVFVRASP